MGGNPTFRELLGRVRETALGAYAHQDLPFEKLVEELNPVRNASHSPLFQVMLILQNAPIKVPTFPRLTAEFMAVRTDTAKFDLSISLAEEEGGVQGTWEYNADLFDRATIRRMIGHFLTLLHGVVANSDARLSDLPLLTGAERHKLLVEWNDTARIYPRTSIHELFESQAGRTPDAVAVIFKDTQLNYGELNSRANRLANYLMKRDVGPETLVGVFMERSLEMVVGLLGILKAGGAYLPLEPVYPGERLAYMLEDSGTPVILTLSRLAGEIPRNAAHVICLDGEWEAISGESAEKPQGGASPENLAYVMFTSGSTGKPKGVEISHAGICNRLLWMQKAYNFNSTERILQKAPFSFDVSLWELFCPLIAGGTLVMARPDGHRDSCYLVDVIRDQQITTLHFVPSMLQIFLDEAVFATPSLRRVICSGETLPHELKRRFESHMKAGLHNLYGPTEASVDVTAWDCSQELPGNMVPIGRPIANIQLYILDSRLQPVPIGVPGELHIGGVGLARGYRNHPELTAVKFIPNHFSDMPGARLYKTGDLARYLPDGNIEFLGRIDHQVKVRGFRIEPGEIEAVLGRHPGVRESVVLAREDEPGDRRLVAYVVPNTGEIPKVGELRRFLAEKLPDYMLPSFVVTLDALPLTPSGKVDRRALPAPDGVRPELEETFAAPLTPIEQALAEIWCSLLKLERVGVHDNFFELGGHSLLATQVISRIRNLFQVEIPLRALFEAPTVAGIALDLVQRYYVLSENRKGLADVLSDLETLSEMEAVRLIEQ
jgi:amino acid adenylation domain-containing protein